MIDIFLAACLETNLNCNEISMEYDNLLPKAWGVTTIYRSGTIKIAIDINLMTKPELKASVIVHEVAHASVQSRRLPPKEAHGREFINECKRIAKAINVPSIACADEL